MGLFIKICGCCSRDDLTAVAELKPDAVGFNFWPGSKRYVKPEDVGEWVADLPSSIKKAGIFVNAAKDEILEIREKAQLDIIQLHGEESPELCETLGGTIWKVIHLNRARPAPLADYEVDAFLLDHHGGAMPGGTGVSVDWKEAARFVADAPRNVVLAGGLTPGNVAEAIGTVRPWGVDVSSGVESAIGKKDMAKVKDFIDTCRSVQ